MRKLVYGALTAAPEILPKPQWVSAGALDNALPRPFAIVRMADGPPSTLKSLQPRLEIWVHDDRGSYVRIDDLTEKIKARLLFAAPMENTTHRIVEVEWSGDSPDLVDQGYNTNTKWTSFTLTGRK